jgi:hypothetical protein
LGTLQAIWDWIFNTPVEFTLPWLLSLALFLLGALSRFFRYTYKIPKLFGSLIHEAGHALVALLLGLRVSKIKLDSKGNGVTEFYSTSGFRNIPVALAGYLAPSSLAVGIVYLIVENNLNAAIAMVSAIFIILAIFVRSLVAIALNAIFGGLLYLLLNLSQTLSTGLLIVLAGVLAANGVVGVWEAYKVRTRGTGDGLTDSQVLSRLTLLIPSIIWDIFFASFTLSAALLVIGLIWTTI